jgi:hypothetical protein
LIVYAQWIYYANAFVSKLSLVLFIYKPYIRFLFFSCFQLKFINSNNNSDIVIFTIIAIAVCPSFIVCKRFNINLSVR